MFQELIKMMLVGIESHANGTIVKRSLRGWSVMESLLRKLEL